MRIELAAARFPSQGFATFMAFISKNAHLSVGARNSASEAPSGMAGASEVSTGGDEQRLGGLQGRLGNLGGLRLLEAGCGSCFLTRHLLSWVGESGFVDAFDPRPSELARGRQALAGCTNVRLLQRRCEDGDYPAGAFDRVVCFRSLSLFEDVEAALGCFSRWLRPHGRLHIVYWESRAELATQSVAGRGALAPREELAACFGRNSFAILREIDNREEVYIELERI